jgi:hypothetical protein
MDGNSTSTDIAVPQRDVGRLPAISADAYQHVGRFAGALVMSCFEQMGGLPRMVAWAEGNPTDFYTKLFPKMIQRSTSVDVSGSITIDDAISRLESSGNAIDADFEEVQPAFDL